MTLTFYPKTHRYKLDGQWIPGVTTLLKKGLPKPGLMYWSARTVAEFVADNQADIESMWAKGRGPMVAYLKETPWAKRDEAAVRGTDVHAFAEELAHGREVQVPEHLVSAVDGYARWLDSWRPEMIWTERSVANRHWWYAGRPDAVCTIDGETWLLDWKSGKAIYGDNALQAVCYGNAEFSVTGEGIEEAMPSIDRYGIVHIRPDGTDLHEVTDPQSAWKDALHVIWTAKATERIESYIGEPMVAP